jgi:hypothetical protein
MFKYYKFKKNNHENGSYVFVFCLLNVWTTRTKEDSYNLEGQVAIQGYDPVAYFKQGKAVKGQKEFNNL